jgi:large subunit ribosomal protein L1
MQMDKEQLTPKITEALSKKAERKFTQSVELSLSFKDIDIEAPEYKLNQNVFLPKGRGKDVEIGVFADGDMNVQAKKVSNHVLDKRGLEEYAKSKRKMRNYAGECYTFIAQPELMPLIGKSWGIVLGPRSKMPQPVPSNVDLTGLFKRLKNTVRIRSKKNPTIQVPIGTADMSPEDIAENVMAVYNSVEKQIPAEKIRSIHIKTTMGQAVRLV